MRGLNEAVESHVATTRQAEQLIPARRAGRVDELQRQIQRLSERMKIAVIYGGDKSAEGAVIHRTSNPRAWKSYQSVAEDIAAALVRLGFRQTILVPDDMRLGERLQKERVDLGWLNTGGVQGYNPVAHAPAMLEMLGVPYIGHNPLMAGTLDNKHIFKQELLYIGVSTAPFVTWHPARGPFRPHVNSRFLEAFRNHWGPYIVKPVSGLASLHVHFAAAKLELHFFQPDGLIRSGCIFSNNGLSNPSSDKFMFRPAMTTGQGSGKGEGYRQEL